MRPSAPGSGKFGTQWLRMHAENACGLPEPELLEDELLALLVVPICATFALDEPRRIRRQAATVRPPRERTVPEAPCVFPLRPSALLVRVRRATIAISSPSRRSRPGAESVVRVGRCITVAPARLRPALPEISRSAAAIVGCRSASSRSVTGRESRVNYLCAARSCSDSNRGLGRASAPRSPRLCLRTCCGKPRSRL
jgi:hypothetical protein